MNYEDLLEEIKEKYPEKRDKILVCIAAGCAAMGSEKLLEELKNRFKNFDVKGVGCIGLCSNGPLIKIEPEGVVLGKEDISNIDLLEEIIFLKKYKKSDNSFFDKQYKIALRNCGNIDPNNIEEYILKGGYRALFKVLNEMHPDEVIATIMKSGLRGRGGGGYPTGLKWSTVAKMNSDIKYLVCNADEGDPGAFMDRSILEGDPHSVIEGMIIAGYAVGASHGYIYVRAEYPLAIKRLKTAIKQAESYRLLGKNIGNGHFSFDLEVRLGAGAFVCGEETALISSIEGKKGNPRPRPPYPAESGVKGYPTLVNNVETFANVPEIIVRGADWFSSIGTEKSKGTKVFALAGNVKNTGLVEVPMGITLKELIFDIGGGIPGGKRFKAVQTGGPSGGCIPEEFLDTPIDYESMLSLNSIMGSGGMIVMDEDTCMVSVAKYFMEFCMGESCGKCVPCRTGTLQVYDILDKITRGEGKEDDIPIMLNLCNLMKKTSLCGLGQSAPNPVLSTFKYFKDEYFEHILHKFCPSGICKFEGVNRNED